MNVFFHFYVKKDLYKVKISKKVVPLQRRYELTIQFTLPRDGSTVINQEKGKE